MSLLADLKTILTNLNIPCQTGHMETKPVGSTYAVLIPLTSELMYCDNYPEQDIQGVRIALYTKSSYTSLAKSIEKALADAEISMSARQYIEYEADTGYHHYAIDAENNYQFITEE